MIFGHVRKWGIYHIFTPRKMISQGYDGCGTILDGFCSPLEAERWDNVYSRFCGFQNLNLDGFRTHQCWPHPCFRICWNPNFSSFTKFRTSFLPLFEPHVHIFSLFNHPWFRFSQVRRKNGSCKWCSSGAWRLRRCYVSCVNSTWPCVPGWIRDGEIGKLGKRRRGELFSVAKIWINMGLLIVSKILVASSF